MRVDANKHLLQVAVIHVLQEYMVCIGRWKFGGSRRDRAIGATPSADNVVPLCCFACKISSLSLLRLNRHGSSSVLRLWHIRVGVAVFDVGERSRAGIITAILFWESPSFVEYLPLV